MPDQSEPNQPGNGVEVNVTNTYSESDPKSANRPTDSDTNLPEGVAAAQSTIPATANSNTDRPTEYGGQKGLEPTRYGDWEKNGRCTDF